MYRHKNWNSQSFLNFAAIFNIITLILPYSCILILVAINQELISQIGFYRIALGVTTFFFIMTLWCYAKIIMVDAGTVPSFYNYPEEYEGQRRYCLLCR